MLHHPPQTTVDDTILVDVLVSPLLLSCRPNLVLDSWWLHFPVVREICFYCCHQPFFEEDSFASFFVSYSGIWRSSLSCSFNRYWMQPNLCLHISCFSAFLSLIRLSLEGHNILFWIDLFKNAIEFSLNFNLLQFLCLRWLLLVDPEGSIFFNFFFFYIFSAPVRTAMNQEIEFQLKEPIVLKEWKRERTPSRVFPSTVEPSVYKFE